ncbi:short-chain dehydrogenase/reductase [Minwuia thermotolerans]|uniref:Short-chain dehydrogenase n=1 Tax=Minwuia thermotolerans TaxID=2056226 RepID=A0A2M9FVC5_9PROT|nr:short-chain dehydrogenase/reductase [Minwuia thermotolerans]PJK27384.1 short-chain dehydrogenase [Minwuia thermotolerans]
MHLELEGRRAVVTGASRGIGRAIAKSLAEERCNLALAARSEEPLRNLADELNNCFGISVTTHRGDLGQRADQDRLVRETGPVDFVVNNAGAIPQGELEDVDDETWRKAWDLKVYGIINLSRQYYTLMKQRRSGVILNILGMAGVRLNARYIAGSTGTAGLIAFTRALGSRSPDFGIRVLGINPGLTDTDRVQELLRHRSLERFGSADRGDEVVADLNLPFGRMARSREIGEMAAFLLSPRAAYVSGDVVTVDGGFTHRTFF